MSISPTGGTPAPPASSSPRKMVISIFILTALMLVLLTAFALPGIHSAAKDIPVGVVASSQTRSAIVSGLEKDETFTVTTYDSQNAADEAILNRDVYGAFVVSRTGLAVRTATAASYTATTAVTAAGQALGTALKVPVSVKDLRAFPSSDPKGIGLSAGALPIALGGWIAAVMIITLITGIWRRLVTLAGFAVVGGFALVGFLFAIGTFDDNYWTGSLAAMLGIAATGSLVLGLQRLLKGVGIGIAAIVLILLGNPLSGLSSAPEFLPHPWGAIGQLLPPGATGMLLRNVIFFDGVDTSKSILALLGWLIIGLLTYILAGLRTPKAPSPSVEAGHELDSLDATLIGERP
jgi:hypothetical protein